jgi:succinylarginine dihydrolase
MREINFDGIIGPTHNYAGLSHGNLAATRNAGAVSHPRAAALQGVAKMRVNLALGLAQGVLLPLDRPNAPWLSRLGTDPARADAHLWAQAASASAMWAANAATVSPSPDTSDGRCHLSVANLATMPHRSHEWPGTLAQLRVAFADASAFAVHPPVPSFADEGAANHMRLCSRHDASGVEVFVYGEGGGPFPARQHREACAAVARRHGVDPLLVRQSPEAIAAGAFHNDVVAVANEHVLFAHEQAFADKDRFYAALRGRLPQVEIVEVPASAISLPDAIATYLFNAQLVTLPDGGPSASLGTGMALILPMEAQDHGGVRAWLEALVAGNGPIRRLVSVDVRESMANGGGPACLRLRVVCDPAKVDPRFLVDHARLDRIAAVIQAHWPERVGPDDHAMLGDWPAARQARAALLEELDLADLI